MRDHSEAPEEQPSFDWSVFVSWDGETWQRYERCCTYHHAAQKMRLHRASLPNVYLKAKEEYD